MTEPALANAPVATPAPRDVVLSLRDISKTYAMGEETVHALVEVTLEVRRNDYMAIIGPSGSGKSTLLNIIGCLDTPSEGSYRFEGEEVSRMGDVELAGIRNKKIGFVFQTFNLLPRMDALANVELPLIYAGLPKEERRARAIESLTAVGLGDRVKHRPNEMSGGQRQRVAIARSLVTRPSLLLADEPTGNLDSKTGEEIMQLFEHLHASWQTIMVVTHEPDIARRAQRVIAIHDGRAVERAPGEL